MTAAALLCDIGVNALRYVVDDPTIELSHSACSRAAQLHVRVMADMSDLPDELLGLILRHATSPLRTDSEGDSDIIHRATAWSSLASVNRRRALIRALVLMCQPFHTAAAHAF